MNESLVKFSICLPNDVEGNGNSLERLSTNFYDASISILRVMFLNKAKIRNDMSIGYDEISYKLNVYLLEKYASIDFIP